MAQGLMNFVRQPSARSPLIQPSPIGYGGMTKAGPGAGNHFGGAFPGQAPNLLSSLGTGLALSGGGGRWGRTPPASPLSRLSRGLALGMGIHQTAMRQHQQSQMEWIRLQNTLQNSAIERQRVQAGIQEQARARREEEQARMSREAVLSQDEELTPEERTLYAGGGPSWTQYLQRTDAARARGEEAEERRALLAQDDSLSAEAVDSMSKNKKAFDVWASQRFGEPPVEWGGIQKTTIGDNEIWYQQSNRGGIQVLGSGDAPLPLDAQLSRKAAIIDIAKQKGLNQSQIGVLMTDDDLANKFLQEALVEQLPEGAEATGEPLGINDARKMINSEGRHPNPSWSQEYARQQGYFPASQAEITRRVALRGAERVLDSLKKQMLSEEPYEVVDEEGNITRTADKTGLAWQNDPGLFDQTFDRARAMYHGYTQEDTRYPEYESFATGTVVPLVRALGEVGNLSQTEIEKGLALIPRVYDTVQTSRNKIKRLEELMTEWVKQVDEEDTDGFQELRDLVSAQENR